jgi:hypothetical protein
MRTIEGLDYLHGKELVDETQNLWQTWRDKRTEWAGQAQENLEFRLSKQFTPEQKAGIEARGNAALVVNRIHPAVEMAKAMLTSNRPSFNVVGREDSDVRTGKVFSELLKYIWDASDGNTVLRNVIDDYYVKGMGCIQAYIDPLADDGKGEVCVRDIDPLDVYIDPNCRDRFCNDGDMIISRLFTKREAMGMYYRYKDQISKATGDNNSDRPSPNTAGSEKVFFPETSDTMTVAGWSDDEYIRGYERYSHAFFQRVRIYESWSNREDVLSKKEYEKYVQTPAWVVGQQVITDSRTVLKMQDQYGEMLKQAENQGEDISQIPPLEVVETTFQELIQNKVIEAVETPIKRLIKSVVIGDNHLFTQVMPTQYHTLITLMNVHTRTPYPISDVSLAKDLQRYINKIRSLIIAHATTATNMKVLIPAGSIDKEEFEREWAKPGVGIEVDMDLGMPVVAQPTPLPNELYQSEATAKADIDHLMGLYEMMMGNTAAAPHTYKATLALDEFGQRKIGSKLKDIEGALRRLGQVVIDLAQEHYTVQKTFRVVNPNNSINEFTVKQRLHDDKSGEVQTFNDIAKGKYDLVVTAGSTLPSNRFMELELYMDAYKNGIVDKVEVLKKTDIFDMEGVLQRTSYTQQLEGVVKQQQDELKSLKGDAQTRDRENQHLMQRVELEKFKGDLKEGQVGAKKATQLYEERLGDMLKLRKESVKLKENQEKISAQPSN